MIPRSRYDEGRYSGTGGGGRNSSGGVTPFFCTKCGKSKPVTQFMSGVDVCKSCRVGRVKKGK